MTQITLRSPAKVNLFLKVQNKRLDGYHNIITIFERINLFDDIRFRSNQNGRINIRCNNPDVPLGSKNLVYSVASALKKRFQIKQGADIQINKRIPVAAGLAGGSSNAATALRGLIKIWNLKVSKQQQIEIASQIGSDVAFFVTDYAWGIGLQRGELVHKLPISKKFWHILVIPKVKMFTPKVYAGLKLKAQSFEPDFRIDKGRIAIAKSEKKRGLTNLLTKAIDNANILIHNLKCGNTLEISRYLTNDLEPVVMNFCPKIQILKQKLNSLNIKGAMLSGSGPSVYGVVSSREEAINAAELLSKKYSQVYVVRTL